MQRTDSSFIINKTETFKKKLLYWSQEYSHVIWLDSNDYEQKHSNFDAVLAVDALTTIESTAKNSFEKLKSYQSRTKDFLFGYLSYDLKNDVEALDSTNFDGLNFPEMFFFQPKKLIFLHGNRVTFKYLPSYAGKIEQDFEEIQKTETGRALPSENVKIKLRIHKEAYHNKIQEILAHIKRGDIYEANFCQEFYSEDTTIDPIDTYLKLNSISKPPFATFLKLNNNFLLSASPERYLRKSGNEVLSQPIKGTEKRAANLADDKLLVEELEKNPKERAENIMIVDLVRNDLSRFAVKGSVFVDELCKVYTFEQVHQLISTIICKVSDELHPVDLLKNTFPMGSMTGAPKISAMKIIDKLEETRRGLYSGTVGYFTPENDFDFNVIIRSILYNKKKKYVSYSVGGAITSQSDVEQEYQECLLKAKAMKDVLINSY
jgi:para-aminobenzoate synthetase component 1